MMIVKKGIFLVMALVLWSSAFSQAQRIKDENSIGWLALSSTVKLTPKISLQGEYQWRRVEGLKSDQQNLFRTAINYAVRKDFSINTGYAFAETYPYGDYPNANTFSEHRVFEQIVLKNPIGKVELSHRFTLEQRFLERFINQNDLTNTDWIFLNRLRYRVRAEVPFYRNSTDDNSWSVILLDEVFVGFGENVGTNVFDQNRLAALVGFKLNKNIKFEAGYLSQIVQQSKRIDGTAVFQYNNGFMVTTHLAFDVMK